MNSAVRPIFNEKLLKSEVCGPVGPTDVLKMAEKSKFLATVHAQYMNSSLCLQLHVQKKEKKEKEKGKRRRAHSQTQFVIMHLDLRT